MEILAAWIIQHLSSIRSKICLKNKINDISGKTEMVFIEVNVMEISVALGMGMKEVNSGTGS